MSYDNIVYDVRDGVAWIRLNRPASLNALTAKLSAEAEDAVRRAGEDGSVRCLVITGEGRGFSAGQDLKDADLGPVEEIDFEGHLERSYNRLITGIVELPKPVVAGVNGVAAGAGVSLACASDVRVVSTGASFVQAFVNIGLVPDSGGNWLLPRIVGPAKALELSITGARIDAAEAHRIGLASVVFEAERFEDELDRYARRLASLPTRAIGATKRLMREASGLSLEETLRAEARAQAELGKSEDFLEGVRAFVEKREPRFTGR